MDALFPLLAHAHDADVVAWRADGPLTRRQFIADVRALAAGLPGGAWLLNLCADRYHFAVTLGAALLTGKVSLLPSSVTPETVRELAAGHPGLFCVHDQDDAPAGLPRFGYPRDLPPATGPQPVPELPAGQLVARVFTSGSTGKPQPHDKTWGALVRNGRAEAARLGLMARPHSLVGTVPAQHMYGFESTLLQALFSGSAFWAGRPFYPADIATALAAVPEPRLLVSTPFHLRTLLEADLPLPALAQVLSATAPLSPQLAARAEQQLGVPLHEIYGCTETGQLASRRPTAGPAWQLFDGIRLALEGEQAVAEGGHVEGRVTLSDILEPLPDDGFLLHGRSADMVNIAGKRTSLAYLNQQLNAIPGVEDGAFHRPDEDPADGGVVRLAACVVAPGLSPAQLRTALRERIDAVFMPRPLRFVAALPRNATGKLTREALCQLLQAPADEVRGHG